MKRDHKLYLKDILAAMESIEGFVKGMNFDEFMNDDKTSSAVIQKFEIIGEAAKQMLDKLVWETSQKRVPELMPLVKDILAADPVI